MQQLTTVAFTQRFRPCTEAATDECAYSHRPVTCYAVGDCVCIFRENLQRTVPGQGDWAAMHTSSTPNGRLVAEQ